jgi:ElaB/YqjD/DUF883 family membrane-anchored ribosome-binding protein
VKRELTGEKEKRMIDKLREKIKDKVEMLRKKLVREENAAAKGTKGSTVAAAKEVADDQN